MSKSVVFENTLTGTIKHFLNCCKFLDFLISDPLRGVISRRGDLFIIPWYYRRQDSLLFASQSTRFICGVGNDQIVTDDDQRKATALFKIREKRSIDEFSFGFTNFGSDICASVFVFKCNLSG